jgi:hypothetical protein
VDFFGYFVDLLAGLRLDASFGDLESGPSSRKRCLRSRYESIDDPRNGLFHGGAMMQPEMDVSKQSVFLC